MSEIILRQTAIKLTNNGGGEMRRIDRKEGIARTKTDTGTDYVVFNCPHPSCGRRNKQSMYEMENYKPANEDRIPFRCRICRRLVEIERPPSIGRQLIVTPSAIITPSQYSQQMAQQRRNVANRRQLGRS